MLFFLLEYALFVIALIALILGWYVWGGLGLVMIYSNLDSRRD